MSDVEGSLRDLMDDVLAQPEAKRKAALDDAIFPLSRLVANDGLNIVTALEEVLTAGDSLGYDGEGLQDLALRLYRAVETPRPSQNGKGALKKSHVIDLVDVQPERTNWLWRDWIPAGEVTVLEGRKTTGKSTLSSDLAARTVCGYEMPDRTPGIQGNVLYLCGEESLSKTVRRRVEKQLHEFGADLLPGQITILDTVETGGETRGYEIPGDLDLIEEEAKTHEARLLVIDVLDNFLGDRVDTHSNHSVRRALGPLAKLAQKLDLTVIVIRHLRKGQEGLAIDQGMGSTGIGAQARSVLRADKHPDKEDKRVLAEVACNLAPTPPSLGYEISPAQDAHGLVAVVTWTGVEEVSAEDLASAKPGRAREAKVAAEWLDDLLDEHGGKIPSTEAEGLARDEDGFSIRTLRRVKKRRGIRSRQEYDTSPDGKLIRVWYWQRDPDWQPPDES